MTPGERVAAVVPSVLLAAYEPQARMELQRMGSAMLGRLSSGERALLRTAVSLDNIRNDRIEYDADCRDVVAAALRALADELDGLLR